MANDGQIVFEVSADGRHAIADIKDITRAIEKETKNWDKAAKESTDNISDSFTHHGYVSIRIRRCRRQDICKVS